MSFAGGGDMTKDGVRGEPMLISRRLIYLNRLVGDNVITPTSKFQRAAPWRTIIIFAIYVWISTDWMVKVVRSDYISAINNALEARLKAIPYKITHGESLVWHNMTTLDDIGRYLMFGIYPEFFQDERYSEKLSILTYNRPLPNEDLCDDVASMYVTMRLVKTVPTSPKPEETVTERFRPYYPRVWSAPALNSGEESSDNEQKDELHGNFRFDTRGRQGISLAPISKIGTSKDGRPLAPGQLHQNLEVHLNWKHQSKLPDDDPCSYCAGYKHQGGYVAMLTMRVDPRHEALLEEMRTRGLGVDQLVLQEIIDDQLIFLLDANSTPFTSSSHGVCGSVRATNVVRLADFVNVGFFGGNSASLTVTFQAYNANMQTLTAVQMAWNFNAAGIIYDKQIGLETVCLDLNHHLIQFLVFAIMTAYYFLELFIYRCYKYRAECKILKDPWVYLDMLSIAACIAAMFIRIILGTELEEFLEKTGERLPKTAEISSFVSQTSQFAGVCSIAVLTMFCRIVELLSKTPFRVRVLEHTLRKAFKDMFKYVCYMMIVMLGFIAFTSLHFSAHSAAFRDPWHATVSCLEMLFLSTKPYQGVREAYWSLLFLFVYFMFAIISVQMFNAIINYSYNRTCEDMEPIYSKQLRDKKIREGQSGPKQHPVLAGIMKCMNRCKKYCCARPQGDKEEAKDESNDKKNKGNATQQGDLTVAEREQVEKAKDNEHQKKQSQDNIYSVLLYAIFVVSYTLFLFDNLDVPANGKIISAVRESILDARITEPHFSGEIASRGFNDIITIYDVGHWMTNSLPKIVAGDSSAYGHDPELQGYAFYDADTYCLKSWNCIVKLPAYTGGRNQSVRVTQRLQRREENSGATEANRVGGFLGGPALLPLRGPFEKMSPTSKADPALEDVTTEMTFVDYDEHTFCQREDDGGFLNNGGIVCLLDADIHNMTRQLGNMFKNGFYTLNTSSIIVEFATYNGNSNNMAYSRITFNLRPTGIVEKEIYIYSMRFVRVFYWSSDVPAEKRISNVFKTVFQLRLLWGVIYIFMVILFFGKMVVELSMEISRKRDDSIFSRVAAMIQYFTMDVYHILDLISFSISVLGITVFIVWLSQQGFLHSKISDFPGFITWVESLSRTGQLYQHFSSINMLLVAWRFLKYLRSVPRVRNLNETMWKAMPDIMWFTCMLVLFFFGFVLFAHINFGSRLKAMSTVMDSFLYCFGYLIGEFHFWDLWEISPILAICFFFPYLFLFNLFFLNVFFAIMDKNFVNKEVQHVTPKSLFKPLFGRCLRFINWDDDLNMEEDPNVKKVKKGPPSRAGRVRQTTEQIREILESGEVASGSVARKAKSLGEVCDKNEKIEEALRWSREEAKRFVGIYKGLLQDKEDATNEENFIQRKVRAQIDKDMDANRESMEEAERGKKYAIHVHELMQMKDQETLAKYICRLESKIKSVMMKKRIVLADLCHLTAETEKMRYTDEELWKIDASTQWVTDEDKPPLPNTKSAQGVSLPSVPEEDLQQRMSDRQREHATAMSERDRLQAQIQEIVDEAKAEAAALVEASEQPVEQAENQEQAGEPGPEKESKVILRKTAAELNDELAEFINE